MSNYEPSVREMPTFTWSDLNCFMRPQYHLCEEIDDGYGLLLLFLTSLFKTHGIDEYFVEHDKNYFVFVKDIFEKISGLQFTINYVRNKEEIPAITKSLLDQHSPLLIPGDLKELFYSKEFKKRNWGHYFIINGFDDDKDLFNITDNLHLSKGNQSTEYRDFVMMDDTFNAISSGYWDTHVSTFKNNNKKTFHQETDFWILNISKGEEYKSKSPREISSLILELYLKFNNDLSSTVLSIEHYNLRNLRELLSTRSSAEEINMGIKNYLIDVNFMNVYIKIIDFAVGVINKKKTGWSNIALDEYRNYSTELRNNVFVKCLTLKDISSQEWEQVEDELTGLKSDFKNEILKNVNTSYPC